MDMASNLFRPALLLTLLISAALPIRAAGPDLTGVVLAKGDSPVSGATVFIYSGGPRVGTSSFCPTCYPDCRKNAVTDARGAFQIPDLDPKLIFKLLVVKKGCRPIFVPKTDPLKGPARVALTERSEDAPPHQSLRGRILDPHGQPVTRAVVEFDTFMGQEANCGGQCEGVDLMTVTDEDGRFYLGSEKKFDWMTIRVESPLFARKKFFRLSSEKAHDLSLSEGATVTGRMIKDGKPQPGIGVGLVSIDRSDNFTGNYDTQTGPDGRFVFLNVPPYQMYYAYSLMDSSQTNHAIAPVQRVRVAADGSTRDLGDLELQPGIRLKGRIILSDGQPVPAATQLYVGREGAWDVRNIVLNPDGSFDLEGIPRESISLGVNIRGYRLSDKNKSLDRLNGGTIVGRVEADTYVEILVEPGQFRPPDFNRLPNGVEWIPKEKPLEGIPPGATF